MIKELMYDNIVVAREVEKSGVKWYVLESNLPLFFVPQDLFLSGVKEVVVYDLIDWLEDRVFPEQRVGVKKLLRSLGLKKYDYLEVALKTRACLMEDGWWIKVEDTDTFRDNTLRGRFGFPEINLEDYSSWERT